METSEKVFQRLLVEALELLGYAVNHVRPGQSSKGRWTTPTFAKGWPDLTAMRGRFLLAIEVKSNTGRVTPEQVEWLERFARLDCARAWLLRPRDDWWLIQEWLRRPDGAPERFGYPIPAP